MANLQPLLPRKIPQSVFAPIADAPPVADLSGMTPGPNPLGTIESAPPLASVGLDPRAAAAQKASDDLVSQGNAASADYKRRSHPVKPTTTLGKIGHVAANIGNVLGDIFAPGTMALIPGTQLNNEVEKNRDLGVINQVSKLQSEAASRKLLDATPELNHEKLALAQEKQNEVEDKDKNAHDLNLARQGQVEITGADGQKHIVDDPGSQAYQARQALAAYHTAQVGLDQAREELARAGNDPNSAAYKLAEQKLAVAKQNADYQSTRAQAYMINAQSGAFGTYDGKPLAGAMITDEGQPVGSHFQGNVRPTAAERARADLGVSALQQAKDMEDIISKRGDLFGPVAGRTTDLNVWLGSQDPDAARFNASARVLADHLAGVFGGRSEYALQAIHEVVGRFKDNPKALAAALNQLVSTADLFVKKGSPRTVGSNIAKPGGDNPPNGGNGASLGSTSKPDGVYEMNGKHYRVKDGKVYAQ